MQKFKQKFINLYSVYTSILVIFHFNEPFDEACIF